MNKFFRIALLVMVVLMLVACSGEQLEWRNVDVARGQIYKAGDNSPFSGKVTNIPMSYVASNESGYIGALMRVEKLTNTALSIYGGGSILACDVKVKRGLLDGKAVCSNQNGERMMELFLEDGAIEGEVRIFNPGADDPSLTFEIHDGQLDGPMNYYFRDTTTVAREATASNGQWDGPFLVYNTDGDVINEGTFREGVRVGLWKDYWPTTGKVRNAVLYNEQGVVTSEEHFNVNGEAVHNGSQ